MFDVLSKDLFKTPLPYEAITGVDVFASKVKLNLAVPWLEVVCGRKAEEEIFLFGDMREYGQFGEEEAAHKIASIACRVLDRASGTLTSIELTKIVTLGDENLVRYGTSDGFLLDPLTMKRDIRNERKSVKVLFEVNTKLRRFPKRK